MGVTTILECIGGTVVWGSLTGLTWGLIHAGSGGRKKSVDAETGWAFASLAWPISLPWVVVSRLVYRRHALLLEKKAHDAAIEKEIWS